MPIRISSVFILAVLLASSCQADLVERFVVRVKVQLAQGGALGSGCVVGNGYVLTAKHVIQGATAISVAVGGQDYPATVVAQTDQFDGPVFLQTRVLAVGLAVTNRLPLNQEPVTLYGFGGDDNLVRQTCRLDGSAEFASKTVPVRKIRANLTSCARTMSGDSGGPVLSADGDVMAVILFKEPGEGGKAAVSSVAETMKVYQQLQASGSGSRGPPAADADVVTIYTAPRPGQLPLPAVCG